MIVADTNLNASLLIAGIRTFDDKAITFDDFFARREAGGNP